MVEETRSFGAGKSDVHLIRTKPDTTLGKKEADSPQPTLHNLSISPNPFSEKTVIRYTMSEHKSTSEKQELRLKIYDVPGSLVRAFRITNDVSTNNSVVWNGRDYAGEEVSNGIYSVRLETGAYDATREVLIMR